MATNTTRPTGDPVDAFLDALDDEAQRDDARALVGLMREVTGEEPALWAGTIVGFGTYHYRYASGREGDWFLAGFAPRKGKLSVYTMLDVARQGDLLAELGTFSHGKGCLYVRRLDDVDLDVLRLLLVRGVEALRRTYPA